MGVDSWYADTLRDSEVVAVENLTGNPIVCLLPAIQEIDYWITVAFDHVRFCLDYMIHLLMYWNCRNQQNSITKRRAMKTIINLHWSTLNYA